MILLDTNVLSALMRQRPAPEVINWLDRQARTSVWTTSVTVLEIRIGLQGDDDWRATVAPDCELRTLAS
jgi:toxin FitB